MKPTTKIINSSIQPIIDGINTASNVVISTMGGSGQNVILNSKGELKFTKDGVSVAESLNLPDAQENIGANLLINAAKKTVEQCGDGTTTTILFVKSLITSEYVNSIEDKNEFLDELDKFLEDFEQLLISKSNKIDTVDDVYKVALTSCKSVLIANLIKEIYMKTGFEANISLEKSRTSDKTYYELIEGLNFESGLVNSRFVNQDNGTCVLDNPIILLEDEIVSSPQAYDKILGACLQEDRAIAIIAPGFSDSFIRYAITNKMQNGLKICLIKSPGYGSYIKENYKDITAFLTDDGVEKLVASSYSFTLFNRPDSLKVNRRISSLQRLADNAVEDYDEKDYINRIHRLKQTGAIVYVGGITDQAAKEEYDRIEDALGAVSSSLKLGYVRGAGIEILNTIPHFKDYKIYKFIKDVLTQPYKQILTNANIVKRDLKTDIPYNVRTKKYDENIIDATSIIIQSLKNAVSLFKLLINTSYVVHNE